MHTASPVAARVSCAPNQNGKILHPMRNIVFIVLVGAFNRLDGWEEIADFAEWASSIVPKTEDKTVCIDGKHIRTASRMSDDPIHIVSAWVTENQLTLAQTMVSDKSNEITAIFYINTLSNSALRGYLSCSISCKSKSSAQSK